MAQLTHNDYLEQASDSGLPGFAMYLAMFSLILALSCRPITLTVDPIRAGVWIGVFGWALQGFVEFGLYIPALAWTGFFLMGWLLATAQNASTAKAQADNM